MFQRGLEANPVDYAGAFVGGVFWGVEGFRAFWGLGIIWSFEGFRVAGALKRGKRPQSTDSSAAARGTTEPASEPQAKP